VKIYESGGIFRANLYFTGKKGMIFRNFRASDAIALATYYNIPVLVRKSLLMKIQEENKQNND
jgi:bifunctional DNase/RNase